MIMSVFRSNVGQWSRPAAFCFRGFKLHRGRHKALSCKVQACNDELMAKNEKLPWHFQLIAWQADGGSVIVNA